MKDAFGSVAHKLLDFNLKSMNLPQRLREMIIDSYDNAKVIITGAVGDSGDIEIKRGVKQGCPLSPFLFNSCIDPLLRRLNSPDVKRFGFEIDDLLEHNLTAQAYADDILLFASSYNDLRTLLGIVEDFLRISKISLNPKKCEVFKTADDEYDSLTLRDPITDEVIVAKCTRMDKVIRYLGIPLGSTKIKKMHFSNRVLTDMRNKLLKLVDCGLTSNQVIYEIKIFIQPMAEFVMRNSIVSCDGLRALDNLTRKVISGALDIKGMQKNFYYAKTKDGGLGLMNLHDRYPICKIVVLAHLCTSEINEMINREIEYVARKRNVTLIQNRRPLFQLGNGQEL
jgi:hypothetical protein